MKIRSTAQMPITTEVIVEDESVETVNPAKVEVKYPRAIGLGISTGLANDATEYTIELDTSEIGAPEDITIEGQDAQDVYALVSALNTAIAAGALNIEVSFDSNKNVLVFQTDALVVDEEITFNDKGLLKALGAEVVYNQLGVNGIVVRRKPKRINSNGTVVTLYVAGVVSGVETPKSQGFTIGKNDDYFAVAEVDDQEVAWADNDKIVIQEVVKIKP